MEYKSFAHRTGFLHSHGFVVQHGVGGVPTAFLARRGDATGPRIGILAEYNAVPDLDNTASAARQRSGRRPGHGCDHSHIGLAHSGAAIAAADVAAKLGLPGEICVIGCPAEEILLGKNALQEAGVFDGFDALLTSHGDYQSGELSRPCHAIASGEFIFRGDSAQAGMGAARNALKSAEVAIAALFIPDARALPQHQRKTRFLHRRDRARPDARESALAPVGRRFGNKSHASSGRFGPGLAKPRHLTDFGNNWPCRPGREHALRFPDRVSGNRKDRFGQRPGLRDHD